MTAIYSVLHMLVDGVCAFAMFGTFLGQEQGYLYVLLYNFCAFALQMPFGAALDLLGAGKRKYVPLAAACLGIALTMAGAVTHPALLGVGNALFHVGGGVGTICEDKKNGWRGRGLGVFVAPGALGLYLGMTLAKSGAGAGWLWCAGAFMAAACAWMAYRLRHNGTLPSDAQGRIRGSAASQGAKGGAAVGIAALPLAACSFLVVILRSYIGMAVAFPWKTTAFAAAISVWAVVLGKAAGGFAAARFGFLRTSVASLAAAAALYLFSGFMPAWVAAQFLFNMTMPITLYLLVRKLPGLPGFSFGFLTFGLFLGFLPKYFGLQILQNSSMIGCIGSVVSLLVLAAGISKGDLDV